MQYLSGFVLPVTSGETGTKVPPSDPRGTFCAEFSHNFISFPAPGVKNDMRENFVSDSTGSKRFNRNILNFIL